MTKRYNITDQEYKVLNLVAKPEAHAGAPDPYMTVYNGWEENLITSTINQVFEYQQKRIREKGVSWQAVGRYQFIYDTLLGLVNETGLDRNAIFNDITQDFLGLKLLEGRGLRKWQAGNLTDVKFHINLCMEWAGIPVPVTIPAGTYGKNAPKQTRSPGESFYQGPVNSARGDHRHYTDSLRNYRRQGPGVTHTMDIGVSSRPYPPQGVTFPDQANKSAGGGQNYDIGTPYSAAVQRRIQAGGTGYPTNVSEISNNYSSVLPAVSNPYVYKPIDPLDNRYDFRTGEKVRDMSLNGTNPASSLGLTSGNGLVPDNDVGATGLSSEQSESIASKTTTAGDDVLFQQPVSQAETYVKTQTVQTPSGPKETYKVFKKVNTPAGIKEVEVKQPQLATSYVPEIQNTRPDGTGKNLIVNKQLPPAETTDNAKTKNYDPRTPPVPSAETVDDYDEKVSPSEKISIENVVMVTADNNKKFDGTIYCVKSLVYTDSAVQAKIEVTETKLPMGDYGEGEIFDREFGIKVASIITQPIQVIFSDGTTITKCPTSTGPQ